MTQAEKNLGVWEKPVNQRNIDDTQRQLVKQETLFVSLDEVIGNVEVVFLKLLRLRIVHFR